MLEKGKISSQQLMNATALVTIGSSILVLPAIPAAEAQQDAWISALLSIAAGLCAVLLLYILSIQNRNLTLVELCEAIFGKLIGFIVSFLFLSYFLISASAYLREVGEFMITEIMPETPIQSIHILFMGVVIYAISLGLEPIMRSSALLFPLTMFLLIILTLLLLPEMELKKLQPVLENGVSPVLKGAFTFTAFPFVESIMFLMILPYVSEKEKIKKSLLLGSLIGGVIIALITLLAILILGADLTARQLYATYLLAKKIKIFNEIVRVEAVLAGAWIITIFYKISVLFYALSLGFAQMFKLKQYRILHFPLALIILPLSIIIAPDVVYYNHVITEYWPLYDMSMGVFLPMLMILIAIIPAKKKKLGKIHP